MLAEIIRNNIIFVMNRRDKYVENDPRNCFIPLSYETDT